MKCAITSPASQGESVCEHSWRQPPGEKEKAAPAPPRFAINAHFCLCLYCGLCFGWEKRKGRSRNWLWGCHLLPSVVFVVICSRRRPGVTSVAELRSEVLIGFLLGPKPRAAFCSACAGLVCPPSALLPPASAVVSGSH